LSQLLLLFTAGIVFSVLFHKIQVSPRTGMRAEIPGWAERIGTRDIPRVARSELFQFLSWVSRRFLGVLIAISAVETVSYMLDQTPLFVLPAADWIGLLSFDLVVFCAVAPFAKGPRRGPFDQWGLFVVGCLYGLGGLVLGITELIMTFLNLSATSGILGRMVRWHAEHPLTESLIWSVGAVSLSVAIFAFAEAMPQWRTGLLADTPVATQGSAQKTPKTVASQASPPVRQDRRAHRRRRRRANRRR
jgi:hypothetical protein